MEKMAVVQMYLRVLQFSCQYHCAIDPNSYISFICHLSNWQRPGLTKVNTEENRCGLLCLIRDTEIIMRIFFLSGLKKWRYWKQEAGVQSFIRVTFYISGPLSCDK